MNYFQLDNIADAHITWEDYYTTYEVRYYIAYGTYFKQSNISGVYIIESRDNFFPLTSIIRKDIINNYE